MDGRYYIFYSLLLLLLLLLIIIKYKISILFTKNVTAIKDNTVYKCN